MESRTERATNFISLAIGIPFAIAVMVWSLLITITAFTGGQAPFSFIEFEGSSLFRGLVWLVIVDPIVFTVSYWIFMLLMLPVIGMAAGASALISRDKNVPN